MASTCIEEAVKDARYNEAVVVTIDSEECSKQSHYESKREIVLIPVIDSKNGGISWQDASSQSSTHSIDMGILRHFRTKMWILPMLNDLHRNALYESSIRSACSLLVTKQKEKILQENGNTKRPLKVLDIGSGTGLLAMLSSKALRDMTGKDPDVISVEMASAMVRLASKTVAENNLSSSIKITEGHSCDEKFKPYQDGDKAVMCTSELLETGLLGEGIIPALRDAWERHLAEDAIVVPQKARVYAQVLEGKQLIHSFRGPRHEMSQKLHLAIGSSGKPFLGGNGNGVRLPFHADILFNDDETSEFHLGRAPADEMGAEKVRTLSSPQLVLDFDFRSKETIPPSTGREVALEIMASDTGVAHGVLFWWELDLWEGQTYSTEVGKAPWQDHWQQCLYIFGEDHDECQVLQKGTYFNLFARHDDMSISFRISVPKCEQSLIQSSKKMKLEHSSEFDVFQNCISYERALQLNDQCRIEILQLAIDYMIQKKGKESLILDLSDFSLCSIIAAKLFGAKRVVSLESSTNQIPHLSAHIAQHGNNLSNASGQFHIIQAYAEQLTPEVLGSKVDIIVAEPYFEILEGWHLQEALNYFYLVKALKQKGVVKSDALSVPSHANVMVCAIQFNQSIADAYTGLLQPNLCGFSHHEAFKYGEYFSAHDLKIPLFQYKWKRLSQNFCIAKLNYNGQVETMFNDSKHGEWVEADLSEGVFHGIAIWVDYVVLVQGQSHKEDNCLQTITTGNFYHQQAFRFSKVPTTIPKEGAKLEVKISFDSNNFEDHAIDIKINRRSCPKGEYGCGN